MSPQVASVQGQPWSAGRSRFYKTLENCLIARCGGFSSQNKVPNHYGAGLATVDEVSEELPSPTRVDDKASDRVGLCEKAASVFKPSLQCSSSPSAELAPGN